MKIKPSLEEIKSCGIEYKIVPVYCKLSNIKQSATDIFLKLKKISKQCFILESAEDKDTWGRYTFLGFNPTLEVTCLNGNLRINSELVISLDTNEPRKCIEQILESNKRPFISELPPFSGGLVGYFSYDYIKYSEPTLNLDAEDEENFNDVDLMLFDKVIAIDNLTNEIYIIVNISLKNVKTNYYEAAKEIEKIKNIITSGEKANLQPLEINSQFTSLFSENDYCQMVKTAKDYIKEGDIFQVVLSNRIQAIASGSLFNTYNILKDTNPSPYMFYFSSDDLEISGASPETLVKLENNVLHTFPLAGTRPRGKTPEEDLLLEKDLLKDPKELAEHNMLVDLGRNDLGKISDFGSVEVEKYMSVERFSHVMHIGSTVKGHIRKDKTAIDAIDAVLPAGTLSGAPKIRACQIINKLENNKRGVYGGAIGYIDFSGNMDICIAIRLAFKKNGKVFVRSGAGIVADSDPKKEYEECINKAKAVVNALKKSSERGALN